MGREDLSRKSHASLINAINTKLSFLVMPKSLFEILDKDRRLVRNAKQIRMSEIEKLSFCWTSTMRAIVQAACTNPALLTIACRYPSAAF